MLVIGESESSPDEEDEEEEAIEIVIRRLCGVRTVFLGARGVEGFSRGREGAREDFLGD